MKKQKKQRADAHPTKYPDPDDLASATECTGILPALPTEDMPPPQE